MAKTKNIITILQKETETLIVKILQENPNGLSDDEIKEKILSDKNNSKLKSFIAVGISNLLTHSVIRYGSNETFILRN